MTDAWKLIQRWDASGNVAKQVAAGIAREITNGKLSRYSDLPPVEKIADENDVSARTVYNAKKILADHGLLIKESGRYYIA
jgi:DNA-binding GntR family transcriptional regulator